MALRHPPDGNPPCHCSMNGRTGLYTSKFTMPAVFKDVFTIESIFGIQIFNREIRVRLFLYNIVQQRDVTRSEVQYFTFRRDSTQRACQEYCFGRENVSSCRKTVTESNWRLEAGLRWPSRVATSLIDPESPTTMSLESYSTKTTVVLSMYRGSLFSPSCTQLIVP